MVLPRSVLKEFSDVTKQKTPQGLTYLRGTIQGKGETKYVKLDGSESLTPISEVVDAKDGDRVLVTIQNHVATVLGNLTKPPSAYKTQEAIDKAEEAEGKARRAKEDASDAQKLARAASADAGQAVIDAGEAGRIARASKQEAAEALTAANTVSKKLASTLEAAQSAASSSRLALDKATATEKNVSNINNELQRIQKVADNSLNEVDAAKKALQNQQDNLEKYKKHVEGTYATKTDTNEIKVGLSDTFESQLGELKRHMSETYAAKNEVTEIKGQYDSFTKETARGIETIRQSWETFKSDTTDAKEQVNQALGNARDSLAAAERAKQAAEKAKRDAEIAQQNAKVSSDKAIKAQELADAAASTAKSADANLSQARIELREAVENYQAVKNKVDATSQEISAAKSAVDTAKKKVDEANRLVAEAQTASNKATDAASRARQEAETAKGAAQGAETRARNAETAAKNAETSARAAQQEVAKYTARITTYEKKIEDSDKKTAEYYKKTEAIGTKMSELTVGARNLLRRTGYFDTTQFSGVVGESAHINVNKTIITDSNSPSGKAYRVNKYRKAGVDKNGGCYWIMPKKLVAGKKYTWSVYVRGSGTVNTFGPEQGGAKAVKLTDTWTKISHTFTANNNQYFQFTFYSNTEFDLYFTDLMLEESTVPSQWTPAPEDLESEIKNNYYSKTELKTQFERKAGEIYSAVSKNVVEEVQEGEKRVKKDVKNFDFGGRNILRGTADMVIGSEKWAKGHWRLSGSGTIKTVDVADSPVKGVTKGILATPNAKTEAGVCQDGYSLKIPGVYTFSVWAKGEKGAKIRIHNYWNQGKDSPKFGELNYYFKTNDWERITVSSEMEAYTNISLAYMFAYDKPATFIAPYMDNSDVVNNWSPAKEDMATYQQAKDAKDVADSAQTGVNDVTTRITTAETVIQQLSDAILKMVTDKDGSSLMTQTSTGWTFNMGAYKEQISDALRKISDAEGNITRANERLTAFDQLTRDLNNKTAYLNVTTNSSGQPVLELGKAGDAFKLMISNTSVDFMDRSTRVAYVTNKQLFIETATIKNELKIGDPDGFVWRKRENGNLGLRWVGR